MNIAPWQLDQAIETWNTYAAKALGWRVYTDGKSGSRPRSIRRLSVILDRAGYSFEQFHAELLVTLIYIGEQGVETVNSKLNARYDLRMTFWRFIDPPDNLRALSNLALGRTPDIEAADHERRQGKAQAIKQFRSQVDAFINLLVLRCPEPDQLRRAFTIVTDAMADAESEFS